MSRSLGAGALVLLLLASLLVTAPARLLGLVLPAGQVAMQGFSGTVWRGKASRCLVQTPAGYLHLGAVGWQLDPLSLLLLAPRLSLDSRWGSQTLTGQLTLRGARDVDLAELEANIPAELLRQFIPVNLAGVLALQLGSLELRDGLPVKGDGRLVWRDGGWDSPSGPVALGSYALDFSQGAGGLLAGNVLTLSGVVAAQGTVTLQDRSYGVDITVSSETGLDGRLQQALGLVARPVDGGYRIKLDGSI